MKNRPIRAALFAVVVTIASTAGYGLGYFVSEKHDDPGCGIVHRCFATKWQCKLYLPMAKFEQSIEGKPLLLRYKDGPVYRVYRTFS